MSLPFVSCICPTYGRTRLLEEAIESFLRQEYKGQSELIICNDLPEQVLQFKHPKVKIRNLPYRCDTLGDKRNVTASLASGDYLMTWGDDDIHLPSRITRMVSWMQQNNLQFGLEGRHLCWNGSRLTENKFSTGGAHMIRRDLYWKIGGVPRMNSGEDVSFNGLVRRELGIAILPECPITPQFIYRWESGRPHISSISQSGDPESCYDRMAIQVSAYLKSGEEPAGSVVLDPKWNHEWSVIPERKDLSLSVIMATHDDYDGVYFTIQALRLYQNLPKETEFIVLDNNPGGTHSKRLNEFSLSVKGMKVIPVSDRKSSFVKYDGFKYAANDIVLGLDCHVLLEPGFMDVLMNYWINHSNSSNLITGPVLYDNKVNVSTHWNPEWRGHDFGTWATDQEGMKYEQPFDIPMQGMACYSVRRDAWRGINSEFRQFGAEEWYIAEKVRSWGGRVLCHPLMKWMHRFNWPPVKFPISLEAKITNYYRGWLELYADENHPNIQAMTEHLSKDVPSELIERAIAKAKLPAEK